MNISNRVRQGLLVFVSLIWGVNMIVPIFSRNYQPPPELNGVFTIVVGGLVAGYSQKRRTGNGSNGNGNDPNNPSNGGGQP